VPLHENRCQRRVNDFSPFIIGNQSAMHRSFCLYDVLTVFQGWSGHELFVAWLWMKIVVSCREVVAGMSLAYLPREAADFSLIEVWNHEPLRLHNMRDLKFFTLIWQSFSRWGREHVASAFAYKVGQYLSYDYLQTMPALITKDARPKIVDALSTLIYRMGQGVVVYIF